MEKKNTNKDIKPLSRKDILGSIIIITIFISIGIPAMIYFGIKEGGMSRDTWSTIIGGIAAIVGMWIYLFYQKRIDKKKPQDNKSVVQKTYEVERKFTGGFGKVKSIAVLAVGIIMIVAGILNFFNIGSSFEIPIKTKIILSISIIAMGIGTIAVGIFLWNYSSVALKGRMYRKEDEAKPKTTSK
jgi:uncharacterized membrane protein YidH (DUF202 family)